MSTNAMQKSLPAFVWDNFRLQRKDFLVMPLFVAGTWLFLMVLLGAVTFFSTNNKMFGLGIAGAFAVGVAVVLNAVATGYRIWLEFRLGVQMSVPRRRMLVAELALSVGAGAELLAVAWLLDRVWLWMARAGAVQVEEILSYMPLWGWGLALLLPVALGSAGGAVILRFGGRAGWTLYCILMVCCFALGEGIDRVETAFAQQLLVAALPWLGWALAAVALAATVLLLRRVSVQD